MKRCKELPFKDRVLALKDTPAERNGFVGVVKEGLVFRDKDQLLVVDPTKYEFKSS